MVQRIFLRFVLGHSPILLKGSGMRNGPTPFRFENMLLKEKFEDLHKIGSKAMMCHTSWGQNSICSSQLLSLTYLRIEFHHGFKKGKGTSTC